MSSARGHHWVSQVYLRGFTHNGAKNSKLHVVPTTGAAAFETTPANVAKQRDFNRIEIDGIDPNELETRLGKFESQVSRALATIAAARTLDDEWSRLCLLNFAALLTVRNPRGRENMRRFQEDITKTMMSLVLATKERYESQVKQAGLDPPPEVRYEEVKEFHQRGEYRVEVPIERHIATEFRLFKPALETMVDRKWLLCTAARGSGGFVTSDHPVCLTTTKGEPSTFEMPLGYGMADTAVLFAVNRELLAIGTFEGNGGTREATPRQVAYFNGVITGHAERQVYAPSGRFRVLLADLREPIWGTDMPAYIRRRRRQS